MFFFERLTIVGLLCGVIHANNPKEDLHSLVKAWEAWRFESSPNWAAQFGDYTFLDRRQSYDYGAYQQRVDVNHGFLTALENLNPKELISAEDELTLELLKYTIKTFIDGGDFMDFGALNPVFFLQFPSLPIYSFDRLIEASYDQATAVIRAYETYENQLVQKTDLMRRAIEKKRTHHIASMNRTTEEFDTVRKMIADANDDPTVLIQSQLDQIDASEKLTDEEKEMIKRRLRATFIDGVLQDFWRFEEFLKNEYIPNCRSTAGVHSWDNNDDFYTAAIRWHTSIDTITPKQIHEIGLAEKERIQTEMWKIVKKSNYSDSETLLDYILAISTDPTKLAKDEDDLLRLYQEACYDIIDPKLPTIFNEEDMPKADLNIVPLEIDGPAGYSGPSANSPNGTFHVNLRRANQVLIGDVIDLALHEGAPGHHLQGSNSFFLKLPNFRKNPDYGHTAEIPFWYPFHNAYVEGWALYAESLGFEDYLDVLRTDDDKFGALTGELFRACRLIVDTGMHSIEYKWTREEAILYMMECSASTRPGVEVEIDRYMGWPGQATGYKMGQIKIAELRGKAMTRLGAKFDIKDFHHQVLKDGAMPMAVLERQIDKWLEVKDPSKPDNQGGSGNIFTASLATIVAGVIINHF